MGRHQPAELRRERAKTETPLTKYSLERGALGSQREGALGAGVGAGEEGIERLCGGKKSIQNRRRRCQKISISPGASRPHCQVV